MQLTETAKLQLQRQFVEVYGLGPTLMALAQIARWKADDAANAEEPDGDTVTRWRNAAVVIPTYIEVI